MLCNLIDGICRKAKFDFLQAFYIFRLITIRVFSVFPEAENASKLIRHIWRSSSAWMLVLLRLHVVAFNIISAFSKPTPQHSLSCPAGLARIPISRSFLSLFSVFFHPLEESFSLWLPAYITKGLVLSFDKVILSDEHAFIQELRIPLHQLVII